MIERDVLSKDDRARLTSSARDGLEEHRVARRANAILLLDRGWGCETVSDALLDDDTVRGWFKIYREGGIETLATFDFAGGHRALNAEQLGLLKAWATATLPTSTDVVTHHIETSLGVSDTRSGLVKPMAAIGTRSSAMAWKPTRRSCAATPSTPPIGPGRRACGCRAAPTSRSLQHRAATG